MDSHGGFITGIVVLIGLCILGIYTGSNNRTNTCEEYGQIYSVQVIDSETNGCHIRLLNGSIMTKETHQKYILTEELNNAKLKQKIDPSESRQSISKGRPDSKI